MWGNVRRCEIDVAEPDARWAMLGAQSESMLGASNGQAQSITESSRTV